MNRDTATDYCPHKKPVRAGFLPAQLDSAGGQPSRTRENTLCPGYLGNIGMSTDLVGTRAQLWRRAQSHTSTPLNSRCGDVAQPTSPCIHVQQSTACKCLCVLLTREHFRYVLELKTKQQHITCLWNVVERYSTHLPAHGLTILRLFHYTCMSLIAYKHTGA